MLAVNQVVTGFEFFNRTKDRVGCGNIFVAEIFAEPSEIQLSVYGRVLQKSFYFGGENHALRCQAVVQRLFADSIARQQERFLFAVPQSKSEHAVELGQAIGSALFIQMHDHLAASLDRYLRGPRLDKVRPLACRVAKSG